MLSAVAFSIETKRVAIRRWIEGRMASPVDSRLSFDDAYAYAYTGTCAGTTSLAAASYKILLWSMTDILYFIGLSSISSSRWSVDSATAGIKIIEGVESAGTNTSPSGVVSCSASVNVTGSGTAFLSQAVVGGSILIGDERRYIRSITDNENLVVAAAFGGTYGAEAYKVFGKSIAKTVSTGTAPSLPLSFSLPDADPDSIQTTIPYRCYVYDAALALMVFAATGDTTRGNTVVTALQTSATNTDTARSTTGALAFSNNAFNLGEGDFTVIRVGAMAWVGYALLVYYEKTGSAGALSLAESFHTYFNSLKIAAGTPNDYRAGLIRGGQDSGTQLTWVSTEHSVDCYYFYKKLYALTGTSTYQTMMNDIKTGLLTNLYDSTLGRFVQGTEATNKDYAEALDVYSWAGCFLLDVGETAKAIAVANRMHSKFWVSDKTIPLENNLPGQFNQSYYSTINFAGYRTYATTTDGEVDDSYSSPPDSVWQEGTQGALLFLERMRRNGLNGSVTNFDTYYGAARASQYGIYTISNNGSLLAWTESDRALPYEFQVWPALAPACWLYIRESDQELLFFQ